MNGALTALATALVAAVGLGGAIASAQPANFDPLNLSADRPSGMVTGSTGGSTSLPAVVSNSDRANNRCLGFGDPTPDHLLVLSQPMAKLRLRVDSQGADTTLVVVGPGGVRCSTPAGPNKDASLTDTDWQPGTYRVWVGTMTPGMRRNYKLLARP
jgi:hypothetical protein